VCLACEQDAIWLAYLDSQGLLKPDDPEAIEALFSAFPVKPLPMQAAWDAPTPEAPAAAVAKGTAKAAEAAKNSFSCDDPTANAADLKFLPASRKPDMR
jgi:hypothetical protein